MSSLIQKKMQVVLVTKKERYVIFLVDEVLAVALGVWRVCTGVVTLTSSYASVVFISVHIVVTNVSSQVVWTGTTNDTVATLFALYSGSFIVDQDQIVGVCAGDLGLAAVSLVDYVIVIGGHELLNGEVLLAVCRFCCYC